MSLYSKHITWKKTRIENHAILNWDDVNMHFRHAGEKALKEFQYIA